MTLKVNCKNVHQDFVDGYLDGRNLDSPEPSDNRSHRYRHSWDVGRREKTGDHSLSYAASMARAEIASARDNLILGRSQ